MSEVKEQKRHPKPSGPMVEFFLSANSQYKKGERIPVTINDFKYVAVVGQRNTLPAEVVAVLKDARSKTVVPDLDKYNPDRKGMPRKQDDFFNPDTKVEYQSDFDIEILKEK